MPTQPTAFVGRQNKSKTKKMRIGTEHAKKIFSDLEKGGRVIGLTNGVFSLISVIDALIKNKTGPANIIICSWLAGAFDIDVLHAMKLKKDLLSAQFLFDVSFRSTRREYAHIVYDKFGNDNVRLSTTHAKFTLLWNDDWKITINSSMNLNENKRCESFMIDDDEEIFTLFKDYCDDIFRMTPKEVINRTAANKILDQVFDGGKVIDPGREISDHWEGDTTETEYSWEAFL